MKLFTWFYPQMSRLGEEEYVSDVLSRLQRLRASGLYLMGEEGPMLAEPGPTAEFLRRAQEAGLEVHLGLVPFSEPPEPTPEMRRRRYTYQEDGRLKRHGLCPAWHENRLLALYRGQRLCETVSPPALHLDYIRYYFANSKAFGVNLEWEDGCKWIDTYHRCQCPLCQSDRLELLGREHTVWDEQHPAYIFKILERRREHVDEVLRGLRDLCQQRGMKLSVAARVQYFNRALIEGQDWPRWCQTGLVDVISPMNYSTSLEVVSRRFQENRRLLEHMPVEVLEGLGRRSSAGENRPEDLAEQVKTVVEMGADGVAIFHLDTLTARDYELLAELS